jgi:urea transporter
MNDQQQSNSSVVVFLAGVVVGGIGGGIAGWLLGGHVAPLLTSLIDLLDRDSKTQTVRFEALQQ